MSHWIFLNDEFVPPDLARVSAQDAGLLHGAGLFETLRAHRGVVFRLQRHLQRMKRSAEELNLALPDCFDRVPKLIDELLQRNEQLEARIRLTVTPGHSSQPHPLLIINAQPYEPYPEEHYRKGLTVLISSRRQTPHDACCAHKTLSYYNRLLALREAAEKSCQEALWFTPEGGLAEGSISNVFLVRDSVLLTPPLDTPVLPGITREAVLELAGRQNTEVEQRKLTIDELLDSNEVFLTNVILRIMPVGRVEGKVIGSGAPGPVTRQLSEAYDRLVEKECSHGPGE